MSEQEALLIEVIWEGFLEEGALTLTLTYG